MPRHHIEFLSTYSALQTYRAFLPVLWGDPTTGGKTYQLVAEQARRISACRLTFFADRGNGAEARHNGAFVQDAISLSGIVEDEHPILWQDRVRLDEGFWRSLREHPVPVR